MEGATSTVTDLGNGWVRKSLKKKMRRSEVTPMGRQLELQQWSAGVLTADNGFKLLFTPQAKANAGSNSSYQMEKIDIRKPVEKIEDPELRKEILSYFSFAKKAHLYPSDFELYLQPDNRVALLDFDKYGVIDESEKIVTFPFRGSIALEEAPVEALYTEELSSHIQKIMKGGRRRRSGTRKLRRRK